MSGVIIEAGICFLLIFTPFAFAGVEGWAIGVLQIVAGIVTATWALDRYRQRGATPMRRARAGPGIWVPIGVFVALVVVQLIPLPPAWIARISPATHALYADTLPGYAEGKDFRTEDLVPWLLADQAAAIPPSTTADADPNVPAATDMSASPFPISRGTWRPLSIYPQSTRLRLTIFLCYVGLFAVVLAHYNTRERLSRLMIMGTFVALSVSVFGIIQKLTWSGKLYWVRETPHLNIFGPFVDRNTYAAFAAVWLPVAAAMALASLRRFREGRNEELSRLFLWGAAAVGICGGIFFSLSRGGILSVGFAMLIVGALLIYYGRSLAEAGMLAGLLAASVAFLVWLGPEMVMERVGTLAEGKNVPSLQYRIGAWERAVPLIQQNLLLGTGLGTFRFAFMRYAPPGEGWWTHADNEYLELVCETGLAGGILLLVGTGVWLARVARPGRLKGQPERHLYIGLAAGMAGLLLHSATNANLQVPANGILIPIVAAALINVVVLGSRGRRTQSQP